MSEKDQRKTVEQILSGVDERDKAILMKIVSAFSQNGDDLRTGVVGNSRTDVIATNINLAFYGLQVDLTADDISRILADQHLLNVLGELSDHYHHASGVKSSERITNKDALTTSLEQLRDRLGNPDSSWLEKAEEIQSRKGQA